MPANRSSPCARPPDIRIGALLNYTDRLGAMIRIIVVALSALPMVLPAYADEMNVDDLKTLCAGADEASKAGCKFYILGVADGIGVANAATAHQKTLCVPDSISSLTMTSVVRKSIGEDLMMFPDDKDLPANSLVGAALAGHFPCKPDNRR